MARRRYMTGGSAGKTGLPNRPVTRGTALPSTITTTIPAPVRGLNAQDNLVAMAPDTAITLSNFIARPFGCETRTGSQQHATGMTGDVNSLMAFNGVTVANNKMFAAAGSVIYDVTTISAAPASVQTGLNSSFWEHTNFTTPGGHYLVACSGVDAPRLYNGTTWVSFSQQASPANPGEVSGVDPNTFSNVSMHKLRLWFTQVNSTAAYYLPINSVGGTATKFDLGPYLPRGGYLVSLATWTIDGGSGLDDLFVAISSEGDVAVFKGTDPSSSANWSLVGIWQLAPPIGKRCTHRFGGDLLYLSRDGLEIMSKYLQSDRLDSATAISNTIAQTFSDLITSHGSLQGWQLIRHPIENLLILNIPTGYASGSLQYVYNTVTDGWSSFVGWDARCWAVQNNQIYYGSVGTVVRAFTGFTDNADFDGLNGIPYRAMAQQAFNYFGKTGQRKQFKMVRLTTTSNATPQITVGINTDFDFSINATSIATNPQNGAISRWGTAVWGTSFFTRDIQTVQQWQPIQGVGYASSIVVIIDVIAKTTWASTDWIIEMAGVM